MNRSQHSRQLLRIGRRVETRGEHGATAFRPVDGGPEHGPRPARGRSLCVVSGKGGTGKSSILASLSEHFRQAGRTLLLDADLGCANAHIFHDVHPERTLADVVAGDSSMADVVTPCAPHLDLLPGGSGVGRLAGLVDYELEVIGRGLSRVEPDYDLTLVDAAAGVSRQTVAFAAACDRALLVTTPDVTAMTDAYAFLKVFVGHCEAVGDPRPLPLLVVNRVASADEGAQVTGRLREVTRKFLGRDLEVLGELPDDRAVFRCTQQRRSVLAGEPNSEVGRALRSLAVELAARLAESPGGGAGARLAAMHGQPPASRRA